MFAIRWLWLVVALVLIVGCTRRTSPEPILIGHLAAMGLPDHRGEHARQGVTLAVEEALADGKLVAGRKLAVLHVDSQSDFETIRAETARLITINKAVALIAGPDLATADRLTRLVEPYGIPLIVPCERVDDPGAAVVTLSMSPITRGKALARMAQTELKAKRAAVLTDTRSSVSSTLTAGFRQEWPRGEDYLLEEWTYRADADPTDHIERVTRFKPDVLLFAGNSTDLLRFAGRLRADSWNIPLLHGGEDGDLISLMRDAPAGPDIYSATIYPGVDLHDSPFAQNYKTRFHESPDLFAAQAYDATRLLIEAIDAANTAQPERLVEQFNSVQSYATRTGPLTW